MIQVGEKAGWFELMFEQHSGIRFTALTPDASETNLHQIIFDHTSSLSPFELAIFIFLKKPPFFEFPEHKEELLARAGEYVSIVVSCTFADGLSLKMTMLLFSATGFCNGGLDFGGTFCHQAGCFFTTRLFA